MADEETAEVVQVGEGAFDLPAFAIAPQRASTLQGGAAPPTEMGTDQFDPTSRQPLAQALRVALRAATVAVQRFNFLASSGMGWAQLLQLADVDRGARHSRRRSCSCNF